MQDKCYMQQLHCRCYEDSAPLDTLKQSGWACLQSSKLIAACLLGIIHCQQKFSWAPDGWSLCMWAWQSSVTDLPLVFKSLAVVCYSSYWVYGHPSLLRGTQQWQIVSSLLAIGPDASYRIPVWSSQIKYQLNSTMRTSDWEAVRFARKVCKWPVKGQTRAGYDVSLEMAKLCWAGSLSCKPSLGVCFSNIQCVCFSSSSKTNLFSEYWECPCLTNLSPKLNTILQRRKPKKLQAPRDV